MKSFRDYFTEIWSWVLEAEIQVFLTVALFTFKFCRFFDNPKPTAWGKSNIVSIIQGLPIQTIVHTNNDDLNLLKLFWLCSHECQMLV